MLKICDEWQQIDSIGESQKDTEVNCLAAYSRDRHKKMYNDRRECMREDICSQRETCQRKCPHSKQQKALQTT